MPRKLRGGRQKGAICRKKLFYFGGEKKKEGHETRGQSPAKGSRERKGEKFLNQEKKKGTAGDIKEKKIKRAAGEKKKGGKDSFSGKGSPGFHWGERSL